MGQKAHASDKRPQGLLIEICSLSGSKLGLQIGWGFGEGELFRGFHPETSTIKTLSQWWRFFLQIVINMLNSLCDSDETSFRWRESDRR
jgi:hypothetical protein